MQNINEIETDVTNHGVVGTVKKSIAEGKHRQGLAVLYAILIGIAYLVLDIAGVI